MIVLYVMECVTLAFVLSTSSARSFFVINSTINRVKIEINYKKFLIWILEMKHTRLSSFL